jgi:hypothetical protein
MNQVKLADAAVRAIALFVLAKEGFPIRPSQQRLVSAGNLIRPLIDERIDLIDLPIPPNGGWGSLDGKVKRYIRLYTRENFRSVAGVLTHNSIVAVRIAEILEFAYTPVIDSVPQPDPEISIPRAARKIAVGLTNHSLEIARLVLNPSEEDSDEVAVFFALLVAYLYANDTRSAFQLGLTERYEGLGRLIPTQPPVKVIQNSGDIENFISSWLPHALFFHSITQRPVPLVVESLVKAELISSSGAPLLPDNVKTQLDAALAFARSLPEKKNSPVPRHSTASDPAQEDVGDIGAVSTIMDRIYNWMGPPPSPISSHPEPSMSSPGGTE